MVKMFLVLIFNIILNFNNFTFALEVTQIETRPLSSEFTSLPTESESVSLEPKSSLSDSRSLSSEPPKKWKVLSPSKTLNRSLSKLIKNKSNLSISELTALIEKKLKSDRYLTSKVFFEEKSKTITLTHVIKYLIILEGNLYLTQRYINSELDLDNLISTESTINDDLALRIKQTYIKKGYNDVQIKVSEKKFKDNALVRLVFNIDEGPVYSFDSITINGTYSKKKSFYVNFLKSKSSELVKTGKFSKQDIENGIKNLITHLKNLGFLEATYSGLRVEKNKDFKNKVDIYLDLYEGQPTRVQNIRFVGNKEVESDWLTVLLGFKDNDVLDFYKLEAGIKQIYDYYLSTGYLDVEINPNQNDFVDLNSERRKADIVIELIEREKIIVGDIKILGLSKTKDYVVKNIVDFEIGDVLTNEKINSSRRKLNLSGLFGKVDITFSEVNLDNELSRQIQIELEEKKPGAVQLGFGSRFNQRAFSLRGYAGVLYRNLWGTARALNTRLELQSRIGEQAYLEHRAFISYYEPFLFTKNLRGRISVDSSENIFQIINNDVTLFRSLGFDFIIENNFNNKIKASWTLLGIDLNKEFQLGKSDDEIREQIGSFGPTVQFDYRNNLFLPTKGYFVRLQSEYGASGLGTKIIADQLSTDIKFIRTEGTYTQYTSLHPSLIWVNTFRGGWLKNLSDGTERFPKSRAFFLGGSSTIRGYDPSDGVNERIPSDIDLGQDTSARGGDVLRLPSHSVFYLLKTEFRFPLPFLQGLWGSLFYDGGSVLIKDIPQLDPYRDAAGFGFRYDTPIGAVTLDMGFKLDRNKNRGESLNRVHINIGTF